jgi:L-2-hydroxyglutarate oxidase LhgO
MQRYDYLVVGGGIIGLTMAHELRRKHPAASILLIEKEGHVAEHASGRNSGVLHAGFYYSADSLKAKLTVSGNRKMKDFCFDNGLPINECGKVVVASHEGEIPALHELKQRGDRNGVTLQVIDEKEARELDPNVRTCGQALYSPTTASVNPTVFCNKLKDVIEAQGVEIRFNTVFLTVDPQTNVVRTNAGDIACEYLINCAGLYADKVAHQYGICGNYTILPFRGRYLKYMGPRDDVRINIYPVPNLLNPFLGVHFTKTVTGEVKIGPTATPAFWREQYGWTDNFRLGEFLTISLLELKLLLKNPFGFRALAWAELRKLRRANLINDAARLVQSIGRDFKPIIPGMRAQLIDTDTNQLIMDFKIAHTPNSTHLVNAVSPAFTCSFSIAEHVINEIRENRGGLPMESTTPEAVAN